MWRRIITAIASIIAALVVMTNEPDEQGDGDQAAWVLLSMSTLLQGSSMIFALFMPFPKSSIYLKSMENVMTNEVALFLQFLVRRIPYAFLAASLEDSGVLRRNTRCAGV